MKPRAKGDCCPIPTASASDNLDSRTTALQDDSHAKAVDKRLARIEGQIRGLRRMVSEGRYCIEVMGQIQAVQESLRSTSGVLLEGHLRACVEEACASGDSHRRKAVLKELTELLTRK